MEEEEESSSKKKKGKKEESRMLPLATTAELRTASLHLQRYAAVAPKLTELEFEAASLASHFLFLEAQKEMLAQGLAQTVG